MGRTTHQLIGSRSKRSTTLRARLATTQCACHSWLCVTHVVRTTHNQRQQHRGGANRLCTSHHRQAA